MKYDGNNEADKHHTRCGRRMDMTSEWTQGGRLL